MSCLRYKDIAHLIVHVSLYYQSTLSNNMTTALMVATAGFLLSLLYLNGVVTAGDASCARQEKVNKALIQSLEGCTGALTAMEEYSKELALNEAEEVKAEATGAATSTCKYAKEVAEALTKSLKGCVEALCETISCGGPPPPPPPAPHPPHPHPPPPPPHPHPPPPPPPPPPPHRRSDGRAI